jgi:hypothetical protein
LTIGPGDQVDFTVRFAPTVKGIFESAVIRIVSDDPVHPNFDVVTSGLLGTGSLEVIVSDSGNMGEVCVGKFTDTVLTLNNNGPCKLTIFNIASSSTEFEVPSVFSYPLVISAGVSIDVPIRLQPVSVGPKSTLITITSDDPASPKLIRLSGTAPAPHLVTIVADTGNFGNVCIDTFARLPSPASPPRPPSSLFRAFLCFRLRSRQAMPSQFRSAFNPFITEQARLISQF